MNGTGFARNDKERVRFLDFARNAKERRSSDIQETSKKRLENLD